MMRRARSSAVPSFLLLQYSAEWTINSLSAVHHLLITPSVIQERPPLAVTARRAGWIGCNIQLSAIPPEGRIPLIVDGAMVSRELARRRFALTQELSNTSVSGRGWAAAVLNLLHGLKKQTFTLQDAYCLEAKLAMQYPNNSHVRAKIRQQLQVLRDAGLLIFEARGVYRFSDIFGSRG
jgi:type II restriction enzyme